MSLNSAATVSTASADILVTVLGEDRKLNRSNGAQDRSKLMCVRERQSLGLKLDVGMAGCQAEGRVHPAVGKTNTNLTGWEMLRLQRLH